MAGIRMLDGMRNPDHGKVLTEEKALDALRKEEFTRSLDRCFRLPDEIPEQFKDRLLDVVIRGSQDKMLGPDASLAPFIRAGLLTKTGQFSNIAARWYYNRRCFPNRATRAPETLDDLVKLAVGLISARRFRDTLLNGFPKKATFQHLFNEAMSQFLPLENAIIPELNTMAKNLPSDPDVTGELNFYVNGELKWCLKLLTKTKGIEERIGRFDLNNGKYRRVDINAYIVVDCRGPKIGGGVKLSESRCTLYFAEGFKHCICQMRTKGTFRIELAT
jgi:hypothetical protein